MYSVRCFLKLIFFLLIADGQFKIVKILSRTKWRCDGLLLKAVDEDDKYSYEVKWNNSSETESTPKYVPYDWVKRYPKVLLEFKKEHNL